MSATSKIPQKMLTKVKFIVSFDVFAKVANRNFENKVAKTHWACSIASGFVCRGRQTTARGGCNVHLPAPKISFKKRKCARIKMADLAGH